MLLHKWSANDGPYCIVSIKLFFALIIKKLQLKLFESIVALQKHTTTQLIKLVV
jgi:hypothetical protein